MANNNISFKPSKSQLDGVISGATLDNGVLILSRTQGLINVEVNLSGLTGSSGSLNTFNNGLTDNNGIISLGGTLTGDTVINTNSYGIAFGCNNTVGFNNNFAIGRETVSTGSSSFAGGCLTKSIGNNSFAFGIGEVGFYAADTYTIACGDNSFALGSKICSIGDRSFALGNCNCSIGSSSFAIGNNTVASGNGSIAIGSGYGSVPLLAAGYKSINISTAYSGNRGTFARCSAIFGGKSNSIEVDNLGATIVGGSHITLTGNSYIFHTAVGNLAIIDTPSTGASGDTVLVRDSSTGIIKQVAQASLGSQGEDDNLLNITGVTTYTADGNNYVLLVDTSSAGQTITLPASPLNGLSYKIKDKSGNASVNNVTIDGNGSNIDGAANASINTNFGAFELVYSSDDTAWFTLSFVN